MFQFVSEYCADEKRIDLLPLHVPRLSAASTAAHTLEELRSCEIIHLLCFLFAEGARIKDDEGLNFGTAKACAMKSSTSRSIRCW